MMFFRVLLLIGLLSGLTAQAGAAQTGAASEDEVSLRPGDALRVMIWREEDLSGEFPVDERGSVVLPLVGVRQVTDMPFAQVKDGLLEEYRQQLRNPSITIVPLRRVSVLGEVGKPGLYGVDPTVSLGEVIALAGGATATGDLENIRIVRQGRTVAEGVSVSEQLHHMDVRSGDQILVERRSWFERNSTFVVSVLLSVTSIVITLAR